MYDALQRVRLKTGRNEVQTGNKLKGNALGP